MKKRFVSLFIAAVLLLGIIPWSPFGFAASAGTETEEDYTDPDHPYIATSFSGLQAVFEKERPSGTTIYIKLGCNIEDAVKWRVLPSDACLYTNGANVVLDLCGYKLGIAYENTVMFSAQKGSLTINDSQRYDESKGIWISGIVEFETKDLSWESSFLLNSTHMMYGDITINGGHIRNVTDKDYTDGGNYIYKGKNFKMNGGVIECEHPIELGSGGNCEINGGTVIIKGGDSAFKYTLDKDSWNSIKFKNCYIKNESGNSRVMAFKVGVPSSYAETHTGTQAISDFGKFFPSGTNAFIDGVKQSAVTNGMLYTGVGDLLGPLFSENYVLYPSVGINELSVTIQEPRPGDELRYDASTPAYSGYYVEDYDSGAWQNGVIWKNGPKGASIMPGTVCETGNQYTVRIMVKSSNPYIYVFASPDEINAYINGRPATVTKESDSIYRLEYTYICPDKTDASFVNVTIPQPDEGAALRYTFEMPKENGWESAADIFDSDDEYWQNGVKWSKNGTNLRTDKNYSFEAGNQYTVSFAVRKTGDPWYSYGNNADLKASVNGDTAKIGLSSKCYIITYTFTFVAVLDSIDITVDPPVAYGNANYSASVPSGAKYKIDGFNAGYWRNGVRWRDEDEHYYMVEEDTFAVGNEYTAAVMVVVDDTERYRFADENVIKATVNGHAAEVSRNNATTYILYYTFTCADPMIDFIEITIPEPEAGASLTYTSSVPEGRGYAVEDYTTGSWKNGIIWYDEDGKSLEIDSVFEPGKTYTATVSIVITDPDNFYFAGEANTAAAVNGEEAKVHKYTNNNYGVDISFTLPAAVSEVRINGYKDPVADQTVSDALASLSIPKDSPYVISDYGWFRLEDGQKMKASDVFEADEGYFMQIILAPKDGYILDTDITKVYINDGKENIGSFMVFPSGTSLQIWIERVPDAPSGDIKGDIDRDGDVDSDDAIYLLRHTLFASDYPVYQDCDFTHNGAVGSEDAIYLLRHTLFAADYPLE